jgi:hypothetical protein
MAERRPWLPPKVVRLGPPQFDRGELATISRAARRAAPNHPDRDQLEQLARKAERLEAEA